MLYGSIGVAGRRGFMKGALLGAAGLMVSGAGSTVRASGTSSPTTTERFGFKSGGVQMAGILHTPAARPVAAVVFCGAWTAVKEQATGVYAKALAERGFAGLSFDHRFFGESGGEPRQFENPRAKVEDVRNAVTALAADRRTRDLPIVAVGICAGGGYMARAVADDDRIRAFAGVAGAYTDAALMRARLPDFDRMVARGRAAEQRWRETGTAETIPAVGAENGDVAMPFTEAFEYYGQRAAMPNYVNGFAVQSFAEVLSWDAITAASSIEVPTLIVHSEKAAMPELARRFLAETRGPKSELWLASRNHVDFYDSPSLIGPAADAIAAHFRQVIG